MSTYGQEGVEQALQILKVSTTASIQQNRTQADVARPQDEFEMNLRLIGAPKLSDIGPEMVDAKSVTMHVNMPGESSYMQNCEWNSEHLPRRDRA